MSSEPIKPQNNETTTYTITIRSMPGYNNLRLTEILPEIDAILFLERSETFIDRYIYIYIYILVVFKHSHEIQMTEISAMFDEIILVDKGKPLLNSTNMAAMTYLRICLQIW